MFFVKDDEVILVSSSDWRVRRCNQKEIDRLESSAAIPCVTRTVAAHPPTAVCLSIDTRSCWKLFHTFGDNFGQLHHLLSQLAVFRNIALNAIAVGV
jgi:hypothetical protein